MDTSVIVPIVAIVFVFSIPLLAIWTDHKKEMTLIEKGVYEPPKPGPRGHGTLLWGLILTLGGLALIIGSMIVLERLLLPGLLVEAVGVALLVYTWIIKREKPTE